MRSSSSSTATSALTAATAVSRRRRTFSCSNCRQSSKGLPPASTTCPRSSAEWLQANAQHVGRAGPIGRSLRPRDLIHDDRSHRHHRRVLKHAWARTVRSEAPISRISRVLQRRHPDAVLTESASALTLSGTAGDARVLPRSGAGRVSQSGRWRRRHRGPAQTRDRCPMVTPRERGSSPKYRAGARRVHQCAALVAAHE